MAYQPNKMTPEQPEPEPQTQLQEVQELVGDIVDWFDRCLNGEGGLGDLMKKHMSKIDIFKSLQPKAPQHKPEEEEKQQ